MEGVDYAWARPNVTELARLGKRFAVRYLSYDTTGKNLSLSEATALSTAGISVVCVWEWDTGDALGGYSRGQEHAREAQKQLLACGGDPNAVIYFAVDFAATVAQLVTCGQYMDGAASIIGRERVGVYGGYGTIDYMVRNGKAKWYWQTYAWSQGLWHDACHMQQYRNGVNLAGGNVDLCRSIDGYFGQWKVGERTEEMSLTDPTLKAYFEEYDGYNGVSPRGWFPKVLEARIGARIDELHSKVDTLIGLKLPAVQIDYAQLASALRPIIEEEVRAIMLDAGTK